MAVEARLFNLSGGRCYAWAEVGIPYGKLHGREATFVTRDNLRFRAVRGASRGKHSTFYRVVAPYDAHQVHEGVFRDVSMQSDLIPFMLTDWVTDDFNALLPTWIVRVSGIDYRMSNPLITLVDLSAAHRRYFVKGRLNSPSNSPAEGFVGQIWVTFYHNQDSADVEADLIWSDRDTPALDLVIEGIGFECGDYIALDFAVRNGFNGPHYVEGKWVWALAGRIGFTDASAFSISGRMLCLPQSESLLQGLSPANEPDGLLEDGVVSDAEKIRDLRIESLLAAREAPVKGALIDQSWNGGWLGLGWLPRNRNAHDADAQEYHVRLMESYEVPAPAGVGKPPNAMYHQRPHNMAKYPAQSGAQPDFGSTKGSFCTVLGDPRWIWHCYYILAGEGFRYFMHFEKDCSVLEFEKHPEWLTWNGFTHFRQRPGDTLRKDGNWGNADLTGWNGYDDQHRSMNMWIAFLAVADSPMYMDMLQHHMRTDMAMQKNRMGAPRGMGRLLLAWAHAATIMSVGGVWGLRVRGMIDEKSKTVSRFWAGGRHANPVKVLGHRGPDTRHPAMDANGKLLPSWTVWEHGLAAVGMYAAWKVTQDAALFDVLLRICRTVVEFGTFKQGDRWFICKDVWYPEGADEGKPITDFGVTYSTTTPQITFGMDSWSLLAILIYCEIDAHKLTDEVDPIAEKAREIRAYRTGDVEAGDWSTAEWWAAVEQVLL